MKKEYLWAEFAAVFLLLLLPPLLATYGSGGLPLVSAAEFSWTALMQLAVALALGLQSRRLFLGSSARQAVQLPGAADSPSFQKLITVLVWGPVSFGVLMLIAAFMWTLSLLLPGCFGSSLDVPIPPPGLLLALNLAIGAYYEEVLYRLFLPESLRFLIPRQQFALPAELLSVVIFACSHRYLGVFSVLNAALCGSMLRICCRKTRGIATGALVHFLYNFLLVLWAALMPGGAVSP